MSAIVTAVLQGTLGLLVKKGRQSLSEKLTHGDVTNQQLRSWIVHEIDDVKSKLDAFAKRDLKTSVSFLKEGLVLLGKVMTTIHGDQSCTETGPDAVEGEAKKPGACLRVTEVTTAGVNILNLAEEMRELNLTDLNDEGKEALSDAKKRFDNARCAATEAFNNDALTPCDRILAMAVRLMATILEKVENPGSVLEVCRSGLEELHLTEMVQENFKAELNKSIKAKLKLNSDERREIISLVCHINRIIYDVTLLMGKNEDLFLLPCVDIGDEKVDPLRDVRVAKTLRKVNMDDCCVAWSFGQFGQDGRFRKMYGGIATNTDEQLLIAQAGEVKVYDATGTFLNSFSDGIFFGQIRALATDRADDMYVLVETMDGSMIDSDIYVFNKNASCKDEFPVESAFAPKKVILRDNHLFTLGHSVAACEELREYVVVCKTDGKRIGEFSIENMEDITFDNNGNIMVLNSPSCVSVFAVTVTTNDGDDEPKHDLLNFVNKFEVAPEAAAIAFHRTTGNVITVSQTPDSRSKVLLYSKEGKLERSIDIEVEKEDDIQAATVTMDGSICVKTWKKVLVL